jgi:hypothetical protein
VYRTDDLPVLSALPTPDGSHKHLFDKGTALQVISLSPYIWLARKEGSNEFGGMYLQTLLA